MKYIAIAICLLMPAAIQSGCNTISGLNDLVVADTDSSDGTCDMRSVSMAIYRIIVFLRISIIRSYKIVTERRIARIDPHIVCDIRMSIIYSRIYHSNHNAGIA